MNHIEQIDQAHAQINDSEPAFKLLKQQINSIDVTPCERERLSLLFQLARNHVSTAKRTLHDCLVEDLRQQDREVL